MASGHRVFSAVLLVLLAAATHAEVRIVQTATSVSIQPDRQSGEMVVDFGDGVHRINLNDLAIPKAEAVVFSKKPGKAYRTVRIDGREMALPAPVEAHAAAPLTDHVAAAEAGVRGAPDHLPQVLLPDWSAVRSADLPDAPRTVKAGDYRRLVRAATNPATIYTRTPIANQTAHPDDPSRKSVYLAATNMLFNTTNGQSDSYLHYLIEIPLDPAWMALPGDVRVNVDPATIRAHISAEKVSTGDGMQRITGERDGGIGQGVKSIMVGEDGNIYFTRPYRGPVRFNVKTARYETAPVDLWRWYYEHLTAEGSDFFRQHPGMKPRPDFDNLLFTLGDRLYVIYARYYRHRDTEPDVICGGVVSMPLAHWDDKEAFEHEIRIIAEAYPTAPHALFDKPVEVKDQRCKLRVLTGYGRHLLLFSNSFDRTWWIHLDKPGGATQKIIPIETNLEGKPIDRFQELGMLHLDENGEVIGMVIDVRLKGSHDWTPTWVDVNGGKLSAAIPPAPRPNRTYNTYSDFSTRHHLEYTRVLTCGESRWARNNFAREMGIDTFDQGGLTLLWDAQDAIRNAARRADPAMLEQMYGYSAGPSYMIATIPGDTQRVIGAADYPAYYLAYYDIPRADDVTRRLIRSDTTYTPVGMGPYAHAWKGRELWMAGYTGVLHFDSEDNFTGDAPIQRHWHARNLYDVASVDSANAGPIKWFTQLRFGLGGKVITTGDDSIQRGGTPFSTGLRWQPDGGGDDESTWHALSHMARTFSGRSLATRFRITPDGARAVDVISFANPDGAMAAAIAPAPGSLPEPRAARLLFYEDRGDTIADRFSLAVAHDAAHNPGAMDVVISDNGLYAMLITSNNCLTTLDLDTMRFVDAVRLPGNIAHNARMPTILRAPGHDGMLAIAQGASAEYLLVQVNVSADGAIGLRTAAKLIANDGKLFDGAAALLPRGDGTTDLLVGPPAMRGDATLVVIPDIMP